MQTRLSNRSIGITRECDRSTAACLRPGGAERKLHRCGARHAPDAIGAESAGARPGGGAWAHASSIAPRDAPARLRSVRSSSRARNASSATSSMRSATSTSSSAKQRGRVVVAAPLVLSSTFLPPILATLSSTDTLASTLLLMDSLDGPGSAERSLRCGGSRHRHLPQTEDDLTSVLLFKEPLVAVFPKRHAFSRAARLTWKDLKGSSDPDPAPRQRLQGIDASRTGCGRVAAGAGLRSDLQRHADRIGQGRARCGDRAGTRHRAGGQDERGLEASGEARDRTRGAHGAPSRNFACHPRRRHSPSTC